jgi:hypothetical protein
VVIPAMTNEKYKRLLRPLFLRQHAGGSPGFTTGAGESEVAKWRQPYTRPTTTCNRKDQKNAQKVHLFDDGGHGLESRRYGL